MLTALIVTLIVGYLVWRMIAHPIHSAQVLGVAVGLMLLGIMGIGIAVMGLVWLSSL